MSSKLILGTAQFGQDYGIKHDGQPSEQELDKIAQVAWKGGIDTIHTSWEYNLPKICDAIFDGFERIEKQKESYKFNWDGKVGLSIYSDTELMAISNFDMIQIPLNILDNRFMKYLELWKNDHRLQIHARSVFLQGLLLMDELPPWLPAKAKMKILDFHIFCIKNHLRAYEAALGWVLGLDEIDKVIVGVNSVEQLEQILQVQPFKWDYDFSITDENVLDPRRWPV